MYLFMMTGNRSFLLLLYCEKMVTNSKCKFILRYLIYAEFSQVQNSIFVKVLSVMFFLHTSKFKSLIELK